MVVVAAERGRQYPASGAHEVEVLTESRERADGLLGGKTNGEGGLPVVHVGGDGGETLADGLVGVGLEVSAGLDGDGVDLEDCGRLGGGGDGAGEGSDLGDLLLGEGEPVLDLGGELVLVGEGDGGVLEGGGRGDDDTVGSEDGDDTLGDGEGRGEVGLPDVTSGDESEGEGELGVLDGGDDGLELLGGTVEIEVDGVHGELGDELDVRVETSEVGGDRDLESGDGGGERSEGGLVLGAEGCGHVEGEGGLVDLHLGGSGSLELLEELNVRGYELVEDVDGLERGVGLVTADLSDEEVGDRTEEDGAGDRTGGGGLNELVEGLGVHELEVGVRRDLSLDVLQGDVVSANSSGVQEACERDVRGTGERDSALVVRSGGGKGNETHVRVEPLLHLLGRDVNSVPLASTTHGKVLVEGGEAGRGVLGGDDL
jgi:hypothetical protein